VGETAIQRDARRRSVELRRAVGESVRRLREDAGLTQAAVARAAGVDPSYLTRIEAGGREPGYEVLAALGAVLGADVSVRLFPTTGPRIHDRTQAAMEECLLRELHPRWIRSPEVVVTRPARGVIDLVLGDRHERLLVAGELNSQMRRLEQQVRWHREKEQPSHHPSCGRLLPRTARLRRRDSSCFARPSSSANSPRRSLRRFEPHTRLESPMRSPRSGAQSHGPERRSCGSTCTDAMCT
jgi:transcriptional regulator with XRE-family HTH domain